MGHVTAFDGIRGFGVMMVLVQHAYNVSESWSSIVDAFFVISGFLITTLLIEEHGKTGTISLKKFYLRRGIRLLPALLVVLVVGFVLLALFAPQDLRDDGFVAQGFWESVSAFFYTHNVFFNPIFGVAQFLGPMWTLSLEEQFYLFVAGVTLFTLYKNRTKELFALLAAFYIFVNVGRLMGHMGPGQFWFQRPDACAMGMMVAIANSWIPKDLPARVLRRLQVAGWIAAAALVTSWFTSSDILRDKFGFGVPFHPLVEDLPEFDTLGEAKDAFPMLLSDGLAKLPEGNYWVRWGFTLGSLSLGVLVFAFARLRDDWALYRWLSWRPLTYLGGASYALYISHYQIYILFGGFLPGGEKPQALGKIILGLGIGLLIHHHVEMPMMKLKNRFSVLTPATTQPAPKSST